MANSLRSVCQLSPHPPDQVCVVPGLLQVLRQKLQGGVQPLRLEPSDAASLQTDPGQTVDN